MKQTALILSSGDAFVYGPAITQYYQSIVEYWGVKNTGIFTANGEKNKSEEKRNELYRFGRNLYHSKEDIDMQEKMLDGKVAIVSGASYGMGFSMAELFAREGAKVVMTSRGQEKLDAAVKKIRDQGYDATGVVADNKNPDDVKIVIQTASDRYGDLDIVINNAAIGEQKMIDETDDEWLEHVYQTNVFGPFRFIREALKVFLPKNEGCIINISSVNGDRPFCGASYTSSKVSVTMDRMRSKMESAMTGCRVMSRADSMEITNQ